MVLPKPKPEEIDGWIASPEYYKRQQALIYIGKDSAFIQKYQLNILAALENSHKDPRRAAITLIANNAAETLGLLLNGEFADRDTEAIIEQIEGKASLHKIFQKNENFFCY